MTATGFKLSRKFSATIILLQITFLIVFALFVDYDEYAKPTYKDKGTKDDDEKTSYVDHNFSFFQNIHALVFFGIGFLLTFIKRYGYTGLGMNMLLAAFSIQTALLIQNIWHIEDGKIRIGLISLIESDFAAASVLIAFGAIFGKVSSLQMVFFTLFETICYAVNEHLCVEYLKVSDIGEAVALHLFAALFGLSTALILDRKKNVKNNENETSSYNSNIFCLLGTVFLWVYWPSFNAALAESDAQSRAVINTFLALIGSCVCAFAMSSYLNKEHKFSMTHIQNSTLAGGVAISTTVNLMIYPATALTVGGISGIISVVGYNYVPKLLENKIHDPCGIHSLHAIPGLFGGLTGVILAATASKNIYGQSFHKLYPAMASIMNSTSSMSTEANFITSVLENRSPLTQAGFQFIYILITILTSIITGLMTGFILKLSFFDPLQNEEMYLDDIFWVTPSEDCCEKEENKCNQTNDVKIVK